MNAMRWARGRLDYLPPLMVAAVVMTVDPNTEFYRDEDYEFLYHAASFARGVATLWRGVENVGDWVYQAAVLTHSLLFYRHGPVPALYVGAAYALLDVAGIDMAVPVLQAVTGALGVATVLAGHAMLRAVGVSRGLAFAGAMILALSPLIVSLGRGLSTFVWLWIPFGQAISVLFLQRFLDGGGGAWAAGIAVANALLGDQLFFLTLPLLAGCVAARNLDLNVSITGNLIALWRGVGVLARPGLMFPVLGALLLIVISAVGWLRFSAGLEATIPFSSLARAMLLRGGSAELGLGMPWLQVTLLLGEAMPVLAAAAVAGLALRRVPRPGFGMMFALGGTLGFGGLFFLAWPASPNQFQTHQSYVLVPLWLLIILQLERLSSVRPRLVAVATITGIAGCLATTLGLVWMLPTTLQRHIQEVGDFGVRKPIFGTTAAGLLVRREIAALGTRLAGRSLNVLVHPGRDDPEIDRWGGFRNWSSPFLLFAGVQQRGDWHAARLGSAVSITYDIRQDRPEPGGDADCGTILCATISVAPGVGAHVQRVVVSDRDRDLATLRFIGFPDLVTQGRHDIRAAPERGRHALADLFPERPPARRADLMNALRARIFR